MTPERLAEIRKAIDGRPFVAFSGEEIVRKAAEELLEYIAWLEGRPMAEARLKEIKARADAATPGPWESKWSAVRLKDGQFTRVVDGIHGTANAADLDFLAAARIDIPDLLSLVFFLQGLVHDLTESSEAYQRGLADGVAKEKRETAEWQEERRRCAGCGRSWPSDGSISDDL